MDFNIVSLVRKSEQTLIPVLIQIFWMILVWMIVGWMIISFKIYSCNFFFILMRGVSFWLKVWWSSLFPPLSSHVLQENQSFGTQSCTLLSLLPFSPCPILARNLEFHLLLLLPSHVLPDSRSFGLWFFCDTILSLLPLPPNPFWRLIDPRVTRKPVVWHSILHLTLCTSLFSVPNFGAQFRIPFAFATPFPRAARESVSHQNRFGA